ncbi:T6SS phospholipase effector Tle1-like catalytic domain-containing protein [Pelagovum pacificum]|uniref:DUF2235 domain-containing protein n=1 Tax=Pelagovum pacificum TaxID=2588711 RepID=A0A5C5GC31_9RHOB|nr:DUF2235 domain-containing protein [Pelagovum pacificum]QQA44584.1 DUF2235 domain-containing protein [Pelagovum pacificum]TNY32303.1 DUF2235 domain-containing protein [Pelagovum pacificum]
MGRRIVICIDGTGNEVGPNETNILKLYKALEQSGDQLVHYVPGVGTFEGSRLSSNAAVRKTRAVLGLAFGWGLEDDVLDAYRFLCRNWQGSTDRIYIFGFSRGAYAARMLAGFIHNFGLVERDYGRLLPKVFRAYRAVTDADCDAPANEVFRSLRRYVDVMRPHQGVPIRALGLFDTVSSIIRFRRPLHNLRHHGSLVEQGTHANVRTNCSVRIVRHACALDERRSLFRNLGWERTDYFGNRFRVASKRRQQYVEQRWFAGYHGDIGGSPPEDRSGVGKVTLLWMLDGIAADEAAADAEDARAIGNVPSRSEPSTGLTFRRGARKRYLEGDTTITTVDGLPYARPDPQGPIHGSLKLGWWPLEILPKSMTRREWPPGRPGFIWYFPLVEPRRVPPGHIADPSIAERVRDDPDYDPPNLPDTPPGENPDLS